MINYPIITISREYRSGGHIIAKKLAELLNIPYYDKEIVSLAAKESGFTEDELEHSELSSTNALGFFHKNSVFESPDVVPLNNRLFNVQSKVIMEIAEKGSAVIVGRCADSILKNKGSINIFIEADMEDRIKASMELDNIQDVHKAEHFIKKMDKYRSTYHNFYSEQKWGDRHLYDLVINRSGLSSNQTAEILKQFIDIKVKK